MPSTAFQPTQEDILAANRLHFVTSLRTGRILRAYLLGAALCAAAGLAAAWLLDRSMVATAVLGAVCWAAFLSLVLLAGYLRLPRHARRTFAQQTSLHGDVTVDWSDAGISTRSERGQSRFEWGDLIGIVEGRDAILLCHSDLQFTFIPKRALSDEQVASIMGHHAG